MQEPICRNEGKLKATMTDKQKELFTLASHRRNNRKLDRRRRSLIVMFESCAPQSVRAVTISGVKPYSPRGQQRRASPKARVSLSFPYAEVMTALCRQSIGAQFIPHYLSPRSAYGRCPYMQGLHHRTRSPSIDNERPDCLLTEPHGWNPRGCAAACFDEKETQYHR